MLEIEFEPPTTHRCDCCDGTTITLIRWVYKNNDAYAGYTAVFGEAHPERLVNVVIGLGEWGDDSTEGDRTAFALDLWLGPTSYEMMVTDAAQSPLADFTVFGRILDRAGALEHPLLKAVFDVMDHVLTADQAILDYLNG